jgi:hypothetical protein
VAKLGRAHQHLEAFNSEAQRWWKSEEHYGGAPKFDRHGRLLYVVRHVVLPPPEIGIYIGEAAHQMRSSLDHIMWLLAKPTTPKQEANVQFPLLSTPRRIRGIRRITSRNRFKGVLHTMPGVSREVRTLVESLQPYHSRKWPQTALLGRLQAISNRDKRRSLMTTGVVAEMTTSRIHTVGEVLLENVEHFNPVLKPGAVLVRAKVAYARESAEVKMKPETTVRPHFDNATPIQVRGQPVYAVLFDCLTFINADILPLFARFF